MSIPMEIIEQITDDVIKRVSRKYMAECGLKNEFPHELWKALCEVDMLGLGIPEELGGSGGGLRHLTEAVYRLARAGINPAVMTTNGLARVPIIKYGTEEQRKKYIPPTLTGEVIFCFATTEPNSGSNAFKMESLARRQPNGDYVLNGQKTFITGFDEANYALLFARTTPYNEVKNKIDGISLFILDTKSLGIQMTPMKIGLYMPEKQFTLYFDDVVIPKECLIGEEGKGIRYMFDGLNPERLIASANSVGRGEFMLNKAIEYSKVRAPFDKPIGSYQALQHPMAHAWAHLEAAKLVFRRASEAFDNGINVGSETNLARLLSADASYEAANIAMQVHGGSSMDLDSDLLPYFLQSRSSLIGPVSQQMLLNYIGEHVLGLPRSG